MPAATTPPPQSPTYIGSTLAALAALRPPPTTPDSNGGSAAPPPVKSPLLRTSNALLASFRTHLRTSRTSMLPSYAHTLPRGTEAGAAVALDLGGSTLRVAVVRLRAASEEILARRSWVVADDLKRLPAVAFFDWVVDRVAGVLEAAGMGRGAGGMALGVTWSFPIEQTSPSSGNVQQMGKGYSTWNDIAGTDLRSHFEAAFKRKNLALHMTALMNDTEATLLAHAHTVPTTSLSLIWGTGINAAVQLPVSAIAPSKFGTRPPAWTRAARTVVVNTEVSLFGGGGLFPLADADVELDRRAEHPGFQPLEQLTGGRYVGEIARLVMVEAVRRGELFGGEMPEGLEREWAFEAGVMGAVETASSPTEGAALLGGPFAFAQPPSDRDVRLVQRVCRAISDRAAVALAVAVFTLWRLQRDSFLADPLVADDFRGASGPVAVAYCGGMAEKHPTARRRCQEVLDLLAKAEPLVAGVARRRLVLEHAEDSGLSGAAVGAIMNDDDVNDEVSDDDDSGARRTAPAQAKLLSLILHRYWPRGRRVDSDERNHVGGQTRDKDKVALFYRKQLHSLQSRPDARRTIGPLSSGLKPVAIQGKRPLKQQSFSTTSSANEAMLRQEIERRRQGPAGGEERAAGGTAQAGE